MNVLFACVQNAGRSQIAEAFLRLAANGRHATRSAGTSPAAAIHESGVSAMREVGVDLTGKQPRRLAREDAAWADVVVTMGCGDECPLVPGTRYVDWDVDDPAGKSAAEVRQVRDEIRRRVDALVAWL